MNIVVPMAGRGKRFSDVGYKEPKPFIKIPYQYGYARMISLVLSNFIDRSYELDKANFIFLCLESFLNEFGKEFELLLEGMKYSIIPVKDVTEGAACTVLLSKDFINNNDELIITDCDHMVFDQDHIQRGVNHFRNFNADGGIWCFLSDDIKWSYLKVTNGLVKWVAEKELISNLANTGTYYYKHGKDFVKYAEMMIRNKDTVKNEYYVAPVYNYLINNDLKIMPFLVNDMIGLGTPSDLEAYKCRF